MINTFILKGADEDAWTFNEVRANWAVEDKESGILSCHWAIGKYSHNVMSLDKG
jgi:hypothetical protein